MKRGVVRLAILLAAGCATTGRPLPEETAAYTHVMQAAHRIIREAFSNAVVRTVSTILGSVLSTVAMALPA